MKAKPAGMVRAGSVERAPENTTRFCVADRDGLVVSVTHSLGAAYGCGVMAGDPASWSTTSATGSTSPRQPHAMAPSKRGGPDGAGPCPARRPAVLAIGTPAPSAPQTIAEMLMDVLHFGLNIEAAIEAASPIHRRARPRRPGRLTLDPR